MLFEKYDIAFSFANQQQATVKSFFDWLIAEGPQGYYTVLYKDIKKQASTVRGTGANAFAPVVNITVTEIYNKIFLQFDIAATKYLEFFSIIFLAIPLLMIVLFIFMHSFFFVLIPTISIILYLFMAYFCYNYFAKRCVKKITEKLNQYNKTGDGSVSFLE